MELKMKLIQICN